MDILKITGFVAAVLTTLSFFPQAYKTIKTGNTSGISLLMYCGFTAGVLIWLIYGILKNDLPITLANLATLVPATIILVLKIRSVRKPPYRGKIKGRI